MPKQNVEKEKNCQEASLNEQKIIELIEIQKNFRYKCNSMVIKFGYKIFKIL